MSAGREQRASSFGRLFRAGILAVLVLCASGAASQEASTDATSESHPNPWRSLFERDLDYLVEVIPTHYIYAVHPGGPAWEDLFRRSVARARREADLVEDFDSYRAVLQHFVVSFEDAHFSAYFNVDSRRSKWPRFAVEYRGGRYVVVKSGHPDVAVGDEVSACDGRPLHDWMDELAEYLGGPPGLETTRAAIGRQLFVDRGNPLYALPRACRIGGRDITLAWVESPPGTPLAPERTSSSAPTIDDDSVSASDFGDNGAWVRIGTMMAVTEERAAQFRRLFDVAPSLRNKDVVVIDVRRNAGGMYNWFMAFLRAFYGQEYADYYARARLEIANTILVLSRSGTDDPGFSGEYNRIEVPPDAPMEVGAAEPQVRQLPNGSRLVSTRAPVELISYPDQPPPNPARAQVYVLTDYGCASACLSFLDEMMRFPGVVQVGAETHVDRRSGGWPEKFELPSKLAFVRMGRMVREGRRRGENEPWVPTHRFPGDIADTAAVRRWILEEVIPRDRTRRH